jgi:hypothetical protein
LIAGAGKEDPMFLVRDIMFCKPGKVRAVADKFLAMAKAGKDAGLGNLRVMTDVSAERYWTVVAEVEVESLDAFEAQSRQMMENQQLQEVMKGYHDLVDEGRREIYRIER